MSIRTKVAAMTVTAVAAGALVVGCGSDDSDPQPEEQVVVGQTNAADEQFVEHMVPHHQDAVDMAEELLKTGQNPTLQQLAEDIIEAQQEEIDLMNQVVGEEPAPGTDSGGDSGDEAGSDTEEHAEH